MGKMRECPILKAGWLAGGNLEADSKVVECSSGCRFWAEDTRTNFFEGLCELTDKTRME